MKNIKKYNDFVNESLFGNISRLRTGDRSETKNKIAGRMLDDNYAVDIYNDMIKDFEESGKDLKKVKLNGGHTLVYVFGKYDPIYNSTMTGNNRSGNKKITVNYFAPELLIKRNELEKSFGVKPGFKFGKGNIRIEEVKDNPNYNPNFQPSMDDYLSNNLSNNEREMLRRYNIIDEKFAISYDLAKDFVNYFNKEYDKQYPELKDTKTKNEWSIKQIEKGDKPTLGYVDVRDKNNKEIIYPYHDVKDKKKIENYIKNHVVVEGRNKENHYITYFLDDTENINNILNSMKDMNKEDIDKQNLERAKNYN